MEERSLRNQFLKGTAVRSPPKAIFSGAIIRNMFDGKTNNSDGFFQSRNLDRSAVAASTLYEEERNLEKWPMTSSD